MECRAGKMSFTLMTYNIERGFHTENHEFEEHRLQAAQRIVKQANPDFLALTEACYGGPNSHGISMDYQRLFGYPYGCFGAYPVFGPRHGDEGGNCFLSRHPMEADAIRLSYKGAVRSRIAIDDRTLMIDVIHPSYSVSDLAKLSTLEPLLETKAAPYIITGDFNTVHPSDRYDWDSLSNRLMRLNPEKAPALIETWRKAELVSHLLSSGLKDAFPLEKRESTVPTMHGNPADRSGVRIDFFFISQDIEVKDAYVVKSEDAEIASDHYPIIGIFEIP